MSEFIKSLALLLIFEGLLYAGFPKLAKDIMRQIINTSEETLKTIGFITISIGLILLWITR